MIQIQFIADGASELPAEACDHSILATKLKECPAASKASPDWRNIRRRSTKRRLTLELQESKDEYDEGCLESFADSVADIHGLKQHPDGWVQVDADIDEP